MAYTPALDKCLNVCAISYLQPFLVILIYLLHLVYIPQNLKISKITPHLKNIVSGSSFTVSNPSFSIGEEMFCVDSKKCTGKHTGNYYLLLISRKAKLAN